MPPNKYGKERVIMKITGVLVDMLLELDSETYINHMVFENKIYGMLVSSILLYNKFCIDLVNIGFHFNP